MDDLVPLGPAESARKLANRLYTTSELRRLTGITRKQASYWEQIGLVKPTLRDAKATSGRPSIFYSAVEVLKAMVVCDLRRAKFSLRQIQKIARNLEELSIDLYESQTFLLTDGYSVYYAFNNDEVVDVLKNHHQSLLLVAVHEHVARLERVA